MSKRMIHIDITPKWKDLMPNLINVLKSDKYSENVKLDVERELNELAVKIDKLNEGI